MLAVSATLAEALALMRMVSNRTIFVTGDNATLVGVISEGDLIRAFENSQLLHSRVIDVMNSAPIYSESFLSKEELVMIFISTGALLIPIVTNSGQIIGSQSIRNALKN